MGRDFRGQPSNPGNESNSVALGESRPISGRISPSVEQESQAGRPVLPSQLQFLARHKRRQQSTKKQTIGPIRFRLTSIYLWL